MNADAQLDCSCDTPRRRPLTRGRLLALGAVAVALLAAVYFLPTGRWLRATVGWVDGLGPWGVVVFVIVYALLSAVAVPTSPLNVAAGLLFGVLLGFAASLAAVSLAAIASFLVARHAARAWVLRRLSCHPRYHSAVLGLRHESWKMIVLTRLNPLLPSAVANYCFGVTPVRFRTYAAASVVGNAPLCFLLAYLGSVGQLTFGEGHRRTPAEYALYAGGLVATIALTVWITRYTRRKLAEYGRPPREAAAEPGEAGSAAAAVA